MTCPHCQRANPADARFCTGCSRPLAVMYPACRTSNTIDSRFKAYGVPLSAPSPPLSDLPSATPRSYTPKHLVNKILISRSALEGERKQVTVLFADVSEFTAISERLGPKEVRLSGEQGSRTRETAARGPMNAPDRATGGSCDP
jgi:Double zinc ribbon